MHSAGLTDEASPGTWLETASILPQLLDRGYARVRLDATGTELLANLCDEAARFFSRDLEAKTRHSIPNMTNGFRPPESAHATDPTMPDVNESFLFWSEERAARVPHRDDVRDLLSALEGYRAGVASRVVGRLVDELVAHYQYERALPFEQASLVQVNGFTRSTDRELAQTKHEDGTLATVIWANARGLEGFVDGEAIKLTPGRDEVFVMPGSILTAMTGDEIAPFYHQVRNYNNVDRRSVMYFSCPNIDDQVAPFVVNDSNRDTDIRQLVLSSTDMFGLVDNFVAES